MNIGIDATTWWNNRGFGRFTRELLGAMFRLKYEHRYYLFVDQPPESVMMGDNVEIVHVHSSRPTTTAAVADGNRSPMDMLRMYRAAAACPLDIMFFPAVYSWFPVPRGIPSMVTLHDAIAEHYPELIFNSLRSRLFWTLKIKFALRFCHRVLTVSEAAKQEIINYLAVDSSTIDVTSEAPSPLFRPRQDESQAKLTRQRVGLTGAARFILYVGGLAPHKNLEGLLEGFALATSGGALGDIHIAIVGDFEGAGFHSNYEVLSGKVQTDVRLRDRVHFTGYLPDADLAVLYNEALALAMPSFSEGFGLPAVEAMACATPVLASNRGSLPEVVGEGGLLFDPESPSQIAQTVTRIATDHELRNELSRNALARAGEFTWPKAAETTLVYLERMRRG